MKNLKAIAATGLIALATLVFVLMCLSMYSAVWGHS